MRWLSSSQRDRTTRTERTWRRTRWSIIISRKQKQLFANRLGESSLCLKIKITSKETRESLFSLFSGTLYILGTFFVPFRKLFLKVFLCFLQRLAVQKYFFRCFCIFLSGEQTISDTRAPRPLFHFCPLKPPDCFYIWDLEIWGKWPILRFIFYIPPGVNVYSCVSSSCVSLFMCLCFFETGNISWQEAASNIDGKSEQRWKENNTLLFLVIIFPLYFNNTLICISRYSFSKN